MPSKCPPQKRLAPCVSGSPLATVSTSFLYCRDAPSYPLDSFYQFAASDYFGVYMTDHSQTGFVF